MSNIFTVTFPDIGEGVVEGEVVEWLKQVGEPLKQDEPVVMVMTDKATVELPAPHPGKLAKQYYKVGEKAVKDKPLYDIELGSTELPSKITKDIPKKEVMQNEAGQTFETIEEKPFNIGKESPLLKKTSRENILATPKVRWIAKELGLDIHSLKGTGKDGRVTVEDIKKSLGGLSFEKTTQVPTGFVHLPGDEEKPLMGIRSLMAKKMSESKKNIPHFSYFERADATRLIQLRKKFKEEGTKLGLHVTYMPFLIKALSLTLKKYPEVNSSLDTFQNKLIIHRQHNVGIAMTTALGLIVPTLKNVQDMSIKQLVQEYEEIKNKALANQLKPSDMKDSTITISNYGVLGGGGLWAAPIINYPEAAILAVARIQKQPIVKNDAIVIRDMINLSWSFDHRIIDGDLAAKVSHFFATLIQNPASLLE